VAPYRRKRLSLWGTPLRRQPPIQPAPARTTRRFSERVLYRLNAFYAFRKIA